MYELPENLSALTAEELQALIDQGLDELRGLNLTRESDETTIVEGERIAALITQVRATQRGHEEAAQRGNRAEALAQLLTPEEPNQPDPNQPPGTPEPADPNAPDPNAVPESVTPDAVIQSTPEPVTAATSQSPARRAAANAAPLPVPVAPAAVASLVAAADVPGIPTGAPLEGLSAASQAVINRMKGLPTTRIGGPEGSRQRYGAAIIRRSGYEQLSQVASVDDYSMVWQAGMETRLPGGSLTAAMGWCAPSQTLYDMCVYETVDGILDTPEMEVTRGGIRWTPGPDFSDIYDACGFGPLTEASVIAGTAQKDCCMVDCPPFDEIRLDAIGLCVKAPLLTQAAYPELVRRFMEGALVAQQHKVNSYMIAAIAAAAGTPVTLPDRGSLQITLSGIEMLSIGMRYRYRMGQTQTIEIVAPFWLKALLRMDRGATAFGHEDDTDAAINSWFSARNLAVQWVYDYQDLAVDNCQVTVPATAQLLMYPAGTWVKGRADVINIDAVYDSTGLAENVYTALFVEEGILAVQRCTHTCAVTVPICVSGRRAALDITGCMTWPTGGGLVADTATAGTPGSWTGGSAAADLDEVRVLRITASPATAWTTGQYVQTLEAGTAGRVHWDGNSWEAGAKP